MFLDTMGIAVRTGQHCTEPVMDQFCIPGTIRASFLFYNTFAEIDSLIEGVKKAIKLLKNKMKIEEIEKSIVEDFELFDEWAEKYQYIIELAQKLPPLDDKYKIEENKIKGCQSSVWLNAYSKDGKVYFEADSDSTFVKGDCYL
jgi:hypothetical protein